MTYKVVISGQNMGGSALFKIPYWDHTFTAMNNCYQQEKSNVGFFHILWQLAKEPTKKVWEYTLHTRCPHGNTRIAAIHEASPVERGCHRDSQDTH